MARRTSKPKARPQAQQTEQEPDFYFERMAARIIPVLAIISFIIALFYAFFTVVTFELTPSDNVEFVQELRQTVDEKGRENIISLDQQNVTDKELKNWISTVVSESMTFSKENFNEVVGNIKPYFTQSGFQNFEQYLLNSGIAQSVRRGDFDVGVYIENPPLYLNGQVIDGHYKWLYQMPLAISFFPKNKAAASAGTDQFVNRKVTLRVQVTRANIDDDPNALQIENWTVTTRR